MAKIDGYLKSLTQFKAQAIILSSNKKVALRFASGDRSATQTTSHDQIVHIVKEIAPASEWQQVSGGQAVRFPHSALGASFQVAVEPSSEGWVVTSQAASQGVSYGRASYDESASKRGQQQAQNAKQTAAQSSVPSKKYDYGESANFDITASSGEPLIDRLLKYMYENDASDLHLTSGSPPVMRQSGDMMRIGDAQLKPEQLEKMLMSIAPETNQQEFHETNDTDFAYPLPGVCRFRVNVFRDRMGPGAVLRQIPFEMPEASKLGIPKEVMRLCDLTKGLVLVTGPTGSGKSTTLAALINHINQTRKAHLITIEDPVEFIHPNKMCLVNQREIKTHTQSFKRALRAALREDPDIVLVGEMRDLETIEIAVETAETGHLVFGTLHTTTAPGTVDRIIDQFPADRQDQIRQMLAESLQGVIAQVLCKKIGGGRCAALEILLGTHAVSNLIREKKTFQLFSIMQTGRNIGMRTMNDSLIELVQQKKIEPKEAYMKAVNKAEIISSLKKIGHTV